MNSEIDLWETFWSSKRDMKNLPARISDTLKQTDPHIFPNIFTMLKILAVLPVTTCSCGRSISVLRRVKTYLRSTMTQERLNGLALLHIHRNIELKVSDIIDLFAQKHPRRLELSNILQTDNLKLESNNCQLRLEKLNLLMSQK